MYLIKKAIKQTVDNILSKQEFFKGLKLKSSRSRNDIPAITYTYDEFSEINDRVQNGLLSLTLVSSKEKLEIEHNKVLQHIKRSMNELGFQVEDNKDSISGRFIFNSSSDVSTQDDVIETSVNFDIRYFIEESC